MAIPLHGPHIQDRAGRGTKPDLSAPTKAPFRGVRPARGGRGSWEAVRVGGPLWTGITWGGRGEGRVTGGLECEGPHGSQMRADKHRGQGGQSSNLSGA